MEAIDFRNFISQIVEIDSVFGIINLSLIVNEEIDETKREMVVAVINLGQKDLKGNFGLLLQLFNEESMNVLVVQEVDRIKI